jgi:3',5'-cyclic AMP phosphodiesterase CpdA
MTYRFAQVSDIHFGQEDKDGSLVTHDLVRDGVVKDCRSFVKGHGPATGVLITGDTAYAGKAAEYKVATEWLEKLTAACGCSEKRVAHADPRV